jgi:hypothetical protein
LIDSVCPGGLCSLVLLLWLNTSLTLLARS